ncbi:MAG TPA: hypothetical protein VMV48_15685 [Gallionellaceae bacterium]|nr:hypothetical protein [Gallionellaceae bacterium]
MKLYYLAAGAEAASAATGAEAAAAGASTAGAGAVAGLLQAAKVKANRAAIRAERIMLNPLGVVTKMSNNQFVTVSTISKDAVF